MQTKSINSRYQGNLKRTVTGSDFISDSVQLLYYKLHILNCRRGGSYANSLDWIKKSQIQKIKMINIFNIQ